MMKKIWGILIVGFGLVLIQSCTTKYAVSSYEEYLEKGHTYNAKAVSLNVVKKHGTSRSSSWSAGASNKSQERANLMAMSSCTYIVTELLPEAVDDCEITMIGTTITEEGKIIAKALELAEQEKLENIKEKEQVKITSMIDDSKSTCKDLGFNEGTEKFADCALKLYSQSVELAAKNNQQIVMQPQSSGSNVMTIYDPVRDSNALMDKGMKMITGRCTLGYNC